MTESPGPAERQVAEPKRTARLAAPTRPLWAFVARAAALSLSMASLVLTLTSNAHSQRAPHASPPSPLERLVAGHECWREDGLPHPYPTTAVATLDPRRGPEWIDVDTSLDIAFGDGTGTLHFFCA